MPSSLGPAEIVVILVVALIVLGPKRLPEAGRQVGKALSEIRKWTQDVKTEMTNAFEAEPPMAPQAQPPQQPQQPSAAPSTAPSDLTQVVRAPVEPAQPQPLAQPVEAQVVEPAAPAPTSVELHPEPAAPAPPSEPAPSEPAAGEDSRPESPPAL